MLVGVIPGPAKVPPIGLTWGRSIVPVCMQKVSCGKGEMVTIGLS